MDNITHSLAGMLLAETVCVALSKRAALPERFRGAAYLAAVVGNNLPDLDFAYTFITGGRLGYLMHHRGHTHTLAVGLPLGLLAWAALLRFWRRRFALQEQRWLAALLVSGPVLHLSMDFTNVYGVHPFWPVYDGWIYGDRIFILEPWFWIVCIPTLFFSIQARWGKVCLGLLAVVPLLAPWVTTFVPMWLKPLLSLGVVLGFALAFRLRQRRVWLGTVGSALVLGTFVLAGGAAQRTTRALYERHFERETLVDAALWPMPGNPSCWAGVIVSRGVDDTLVLRRAMLAPFASVISAAHCPRYRLPTTAPLVEVTAEPDARVHWGKELRAPIVQWQALAKRCDVHAFLRFSRAPFWVERDGALLVGDLRFDRTEGEDFAEARFPKPPGACPQWIPSWTPPRAEILGL